MSYAAHRSGKWPTTCVWIHPPCGGQGPGEAHGDGKEQHWGAGNREYDGCSSVKTLPHELVRPCRKTVWQYRSSQNKHLPQDPGIPEQADT